MAGCCKRDCARFFDARLASRVARRYRRRGLDGTAEKMVAFLRERGIEGASVLEIGGGVGEIGIELAKAGAGRVENLELSPAYETEARKLAEDNGVADAVAWRMHDIAEDPEAVEPADVVVMHRVVCCYPDYERLLGVTARRARRMLVFSYPRRNAVSRFFVSAANLLQRLEGSTFRAFTHPPAAMTAVLEGHALKATYEHHALVWQIAGHERS